MGATRAVAAAAGAVAAAAHVAHPEEYVNTLQGTWSKTDYSTGGTLPLVGRPWGMTNWAPQTTDLVGSGGRWFYPLDRRFFGIRCTHQPSPWMGDYAWFHVMPQVGALMQPGAGYGGYDPTRAETLFRPYLFNATVFMHDTTVAVTATERAAVLRFRFPPLRTGPTNAADQTRRLVFVMPGSKDWADVVGDEVLAWTGSSSGGVPDDFKMHVYAQIRGAPVARVNATPMDCGEAQEVAVQIAEFVLWHEGERVDVSNASATATNPGGDNPGGEGPEKALDGTVESKWLDFKVQPLVVQFRAAAAADSWSFTTADDAEGRDPVRWAVETSDDGAAWHAVQAEEEDFPTPTQRKAATQAFHFAAPARAVWYRLRVTKVRAQQNDQRCPAVTVEFDERDAATEAVEVVVGTSYISLDQARANADREVGARGFDAVLEESKEAWRRTLSRVDVGDSGLAAGSAAEAERLATLYGCLYRASMFPHRMTEYASDGSPKHYSPYDGRVHDGVMSTDHGFWDAYRTVYPLQNLIFPDVAGELLQGFVNSYREGGWLPSWPSPGYRSIMVGTFQDVSLADAIVKNITGFEWEGAYEGMLKDADVEPPADVIGGRQGLTNYTTLGYVAHEHAHASTARTLNYAFADFAIAQAAAALGHAADHDRLMARSQHFRNVFDAETRFNRGRLENGSWVTPFDQYAWGGDYVEGGPWTFLFEAVWDIDGMAALFGGRDGLCARVAELLAEPPRYTLGGYGSQIHEQVELPLQREPVPGAEDALPLPESARVTGFGQYEHNNQPAHHILYVAAAAGCPRTTQFWVRATMDKLYSSTHFSGDEDNGEMGAWYVFSALGLYPLVPGTASYVLGSPLMREATVTLPSGAALRVVAHGNTQRTPYVRRVELNGEELHATVSHAALTRGGVLEFWMEEEQGGGVPEPPARGAWLAAAAPTAGSRLGMCAGWIAFAALAAHTALAAARRRRAGAAPPTTAKAAPQLAAGRTDNLQDADV